MHKNILLKGLAPTLVLFSSQAAAVPFQSLDPRSFGMGGAGVASGTSANAGFMNPALLAAAHEDEDFSLELPIIAARVYDPDELMDEIDTYQDNNLEGGLDVAIDAFNTTPSNATAAAVGSAADAMLTQFLKMDNKAIQGEVSAGFVVGIPSKKIGASLTANARVVAGGLLDVTDADQTLMNGIIAAANTSVAALSSNSAINDQLTGTEDVVDKLTSNLQGRGAVISEVALSLAREVEVAGHSFAVGVTPKYVTVTTFDYQIDVNTADLETDQGEKEYTDFNLDLGFVKSYDSGWKTGLAIKNIIGQDYQTALGNTVKIEPQARIGIAHSTEWTTVALDVDLNENESVGFDSKTQYAALGAELDIFDTVDIRIGYRHNMSDSDTSIATAGLGFSVFGAHVDVAGGFNQDEIGVSAQLGFRF